MFKIWKKIQMNVVVRAIVKRNILYSGASNAKNNNTINTIIRVK